MKKSNLGMLFALVSFALLIALFTLPLAFPVIVEVAPNLLFWSSPIVALGGLVCVVLAMRNREPLPHMVTALILNLICLLIFGGILMLTQAF